MSKTIKTFNPETAVCTFQDGPMLHFVAYYNSKAVGSGTVETEAEATKQGWRMIESAKRKEANEPR